MSLEMKWWTIREMCSSGVKGGEKGLVTQGASAKAGDNTYLVTLNFAM